MSAKDERRKRLAALKAQGLSHARAMARLEAASIAAEGRWELAPALEAIYAPVRAGLRKRGHDGEPGCAYCAAYGLCMLHGLEDREAG